jgi:hypothetical protein
MKKQDNPKVKRLGVWNLYQEDLEVGFLVQPIHLEAYDTASLK